MRYCPYCRRLNPGKPAICHYCGRTWYIRICPRGHENPPGALHCGTCGSVDLSQTAGAKPWYLIVFKLFLWLLVILFCWLFITTLLNNSRPGIGHSLVSFIVPICLLLIGFQLCLSLLPQFISRPVQRTVRFIMEMVMGAIGWVLRWFWDFIRF